MPDSRLRLIVCNNERLGTGQRSCVGSGNLEYIADMRQRLKTHQLDIPIIERACLNKCEQGPVMRIAPGGRFYTGINERVLDDIIIELKHLIVASKSI